ncbi:uncharacterized protein A4U43_C10F9120 [Asparagus officinalis]|uniref:Uncharacterized protein n=1 Tax=Asparagus officinalis TaxID=4686 RepID=A0A5P1E4T4_ASPOF|nr:uncharacterized protein A4U43_C10F9120 [Asparagus officinalis]
MTARQDARSASGGADLRRRAVSARELRAVGGTAVWRGPLRDDCQGGGKDVRCGKELGEVAAVARDVAA